MFPLNPWWFWVASGHKLPEIDPSKETIWFLLYFFAISFVLGGGFMLFTSKVIKYGNSHFEIYFSLSLFVWLVIFIGAILLGAKKILK